MSDHAPFDAIAVNGAVTDAAAAAAAGAVAAAAPAIPTGASTGTTPTGAAAGADDPPPRDGSEFDEEETKSEAARRAVADAAVAAAARRTAAGMAARSSTAVIAELSRDLAAANARLAISARAASTDGNLIDEGYDSVYPDAGAPPRPTRPTPLVGPTSGRLSRRADNRERNTRDDFDDGFDAVVLPDGADDTLGAFSIPACVERRDGLPVPFDPEDTRHTATFTAGSRDAHEARAWYQSLAWTERLSNSIQAHLHDDNMVDDEELVYLLLCARRIYALGAARYDFLALRQSEPNLADAYAHSTAVPRNTLRGSSAREFLTRVVRAEVRASAKIGAAARGFRAPRLGGTGALRVYDKIGGGQRTPRDCSPPEAPQDSSLEEPDGSRRGEGDQ